MTERPPTSPTSDRLGQGTVVNRRRRPGPPELYARRTIPKGPAVKAAAAGLAVLLLVQLLLTRWSMEHSIENRAYAAVRRGGFIAVTVDASGRDVTLAGRTSTLAEAYQAARLAADQEGVRKVSSKIVVDPDILIEARKKAEAKANAALAENGLAPVASTPVPTLPATPTVTAVIEAGKVRLGGVVGDAATHDALERAATRVFGAGAVTDELLVSRAAGSAGTGALYDALNALDRAATGTFRLQQGYLTISGTVPTVAVHDTVLARAAAALGDPTKVTDNLVVVTGGPDEALVQQLSSLPSPAFVKATARLTAAGTRTVQDIASALRASPGLRVRIEGHVDTKSSAAADRDSSGDRAAAVRDALVDDGIAADRLDVAGYGDTSPLVPDTKPVNRVINTRVDVAVLS